MYPRQNDQKSIIKFKDENLEVRVEKTKLGAWKCRIKDLKTGREKLGPYVPGNPQDFDFEPKTEKWVPKD